jgi:uncharacterized protein
MKNATAVIGATPKRDRYAYLATTKLKRYGHKVYPVGIHKGDIEGEKIITERPVPDDVGTVTLYVGPRNQVHWIDYILSLKPNRIIFNPGTENPELENKAFAQGIECIHGCTLVMLGTGEY